MGLFLFYFYVFFIMIPFTGDFTQYIGIEMAVKG